MSEHQPVLPDPARSRAVLIGTSSYTDPAFPALPGVENNLNDLVKVLTSPHGAGLPPENCVVLHDPPDQIGVGSQITRAAAEAEDVLFVYYAGHGEMTWDKKNELCLTMRDTMPDSLRTSALRCEDLRHYLHRSQARTRVLVLDCCYAARELPDTMSASSSVIEHVRINGTYVLAAAYGKALAPSGMRNTLFTGELLRVLGEGVPAEPTMLLTLDALFREVLASMRGQGHPEPSCNHSNNAAWLALAPNAAHKIHRALQDVEARLEELDEVEARTTAACDLTTDRIRDAGLPPFVPAAPGLRHRLEALQAMVKAGRRPEEVVLGALDADVTDAGAAAERQRLRAEEPMATRHELRQRLDLYRLVAAKEGFAEEIDLRRKHDTAWNLLWVKPCDLPAAVHAVEASVQAVVRRRERKRTENER